MRAAAGRRVAAADWLARRLAGGGGHVLAVQPMALLGGCRRVGAAMHEPGRPLAGWGGYWGHGTAPSWKRCPLAGCHGLLQAGVAAAWRGRPLPGEGGRWLASAAVGRLRPLGAGLRGRLPVVTAVGWRGWVLSRGGDCGRGRWYARGADEAAGLSAHKDGACKHYRARAASVRSTARQHSIKFPTFVSSMWLLTEVDSVQCTATKPTPMGLRLGVVGPTRRFVCSNFLNVVAVRRSMTGRHKMPLVCCGRGRKP